MRSHRWWSRNSRTTGRAGQWQLRVPTLMIWGDHDPVVPVKDAQAVAALVPHARLEVLAAGHVPQLGHPARVAALIEEFAHSIP
ncbi:alpha/beta fold hydrolase [Rhodococcus rhodochrous]|uniref:alpha/beta fold hydrolase n=1 Tax=Rhodococcus rhodochrous TaxID=1829 RepID=UPI001E37CF2F|nr:alpha/beta fold hydrolase [Rhodococcus rhodochrous]